MSIDLNKIYILNPNYDLRNDIYRVILFSRDRMNKSSSTNWSSFIHPVQAALLSFFTAKRTLKENLILISNFFNKKEGDLLRRVLPLIENKQILKILWKGHDIYLPRCLLIEWNADIPIRHLELSQFNCSNPIDLVSRRLYSGPLSLTLMLTNECSTRCNYCYADIFTKVRRKVPTERLLDLIDEAVELKVSNINLIGGEVFLYKDWNIILRKLVENHIAPEYISTKLPLNEEIIKRIIETGYSNPVQVSLDANDSVILEKTIAVRKDYLEKIRHSIRILDRSDLKYHIATVITKYNSQLHIIQNLFEDLSALRNLTDWRISPVSHSVNMDYNYFQKMTASKEQLACLFDQIEKYIVPEAGFPIYMNRNFHRETYYCETGSADFKGAKCSALNTHLFILPDGKVTICEQLYWHPQFVIGDINTEALRDIWNSPQSLSLHQLDRNRIQRMSPCYSCKIAESCFSANNRCWAEIIKAYGTDNWDFPDPRCRFAPERISQITKTSHDMLT